MTVYRITADGRRRRLGNGNVRAVDLSGSRWTDVAGATGMGVGMAAPAGAWANAHGEATLLWSVSATLTTAGLLGHTVVRFGAFGALVAVEHTHGSTALGIRSHGRLVGAQPLVGYAVQSLALTGRLVGSYSLSGAARVVARVAGDLRPFASIRGLAALGVAVSGRLTVAPARRWQEMWREAYQTRREVLNAIDANNRLLAKSAGDLASANADAIIVTKVEVGIIDDKVTAESQRTTVLTANVGELSAEVVGNRQAQVAGDSALSTRLDQTSLTLGNKADTSTLNAQISRIDQQGNQLTAQSNAISQVQADLTGKASSQAMQSLDSYVRQDVDGRVQANASAITQVGVKADNAATATTVMRVDVDAVTGKINSSYTLALVAGNKVAGMVAQNNGEVSNISFLSDNTEFVSADGVFSITGGRTIIRTGGYMTVEGKPFGVGNEFTRWRGPAVANLTDCNRANAINYESVDGYTFSRGGFIGGNRVTSGFNPGLAVPIAYNTGVFGTGGAAIAVNATYVYNKMDSTSSINGRFTPGAGTTGATIQLWRKIGTGAFQLVASQSPVGSLNILTTGDSTDVAIWSINGAINYIDNAGGTADRTYELRVTSRSLQAANHNGQGAVLVDQNQATGVTTLE